MAAIGGCWLKKRGEPIKLPILEADQPTALFRLV
jgi:hypothetical protein